MGKGFSILEVEKIIEENISNISLNGAFIARQLDISRMQLHRKLIGFLGLNARDYIKFKRIEKAKILLTEANQPIYIISNQTGFSSVAYFSKVFKETVGVNPSSFK
ncbi:MAG: helix-turn-helix domain-containing protein [Saprospiraceae bacterium]